MLKTPYRLNPNNPTPPLGWNQCWTSDFQITECYVKTKRKNNTCFAYVGIGWEWSVAVFIIINHCESYWECDEQTCLNNDSEMKSQTGVNYHWNIVYGHITSTYSGENKHVKLWSAWNYCTWTVTWMSPSRVLHTRTAFQFLFPCVIEFSSCVVMLWFYAFSIGRPKHVRVMAGALEGDLFVGPKAEEHRGLLSIR